MSNITIERAETTVVWDIRDSAHGVSTQATFKPFKRTGNGHEGFCISFNGEFAGLDHCWTHPGRDIVAFLRQLEFDYAMNKLLGARHEDVFDTDAMNEEYFDWMRKAFESEEDGEDFVSEAEDIVMMIGGEGEIAYETFNGYMEYIASPSESAICWEMKERYNELIDSFKNKNHYKWIYTYFWESIWPVFVDAVEVHMKERAQ